MSTPTWDADYIKARANMAAYNKPECEERIAELLALRDAASRCDCGQECYCARNFEYAEAELEKLGLDPTRIGIRGPRRGSRSSTRISRRR